VSHTTHAEANGFVVGNVHLGGRFYADLSAWGLLTLLAHL